MLKLISLRLVIIIGISLAVTCAGFLVTFLFQRRFMVSWFGFECGVLGGFVSIQQRIKRARLDDLKLLAESWATLAISPIVGGLFALVLYLVFLSQIVRSDLFPVFYMPAFSSPPAADDLKNLFLQTNPSTPVDFAKFGFWSFVSGFSERFVLRVIRSVTGDRQTDKKEGE